MSVLPTDYEAYRFPVSVKGVVLRAGAVILVYNTRDEWELPGGKLEPGETPERCVAREIVEELHLAVEPMELIDAWVYPVLPGKPVLVITYGCREREELEPVLSDEHRALRWVPLDEIEALAMPAQYKQSIRTWAMRAARDGSAMGDYSCRSALPPSAAGAPTGGRASRGDS